MCGGLGDGSSLRTELVLEALDVALERRKPGAVVHHSDQGCQYTSVVFSSRCRQRGVRLSMGSVGDCYDNALHENLSSKLSFKLDQLQILTDSTLLQAHLSMEKVCCRQKS